ncbi:DUF302 domain-containing protein [Catellatospora chokoriensis]|uniref:DUF302 domain-containing protein n=1 Tax=Catellatospora chokoriensis TaxID=310353 RepID=A0A8J3JVP9_9ACTN|nr:DUF302 domain-containing protein [Catellatospora chokoriensis]GIF91967.1 hypothetical protein Cch02nite_54110 [Catellatospora chokoriensis]
MSARTTTTVPLERVTFTSQRAFDDVVTGIYQGIGRPDFGALLRDLDAAKDFGAYRRIVEDAVGPIGLMRFLELDEGAALAINPEISAFRLVRIIAGNPLTMSQMARYVPDAGTYAPVTILVHEAPDGVRVGYDTVASALRPYGDERALAVAEELDRKVLALLDAATTG